VALQALFNGCRFGFVEVPVFGAMLFFRKFRVGVGLLPIRFEALDLIGGEDAGVVRILIVFFVGGGKKRGEFGHTEALSFHFGEQFGELALEDFGVGDELGTPAAGGDGFEVGFEVVDVAGEGSADLVAGEEGLVGEGDGDAGEELAAELVDVRACSVFARGQCFQVGTILFPPVFERLEETGVGGTDAFIGADEGSDGAALGDFGREDF
jgi:hypothetical protein